MKKEMTVLAAALCALPLLAKIELGTPFADHAVLQRGMKVPVWGKAAPGAKVTVMFAGQKKTALAGVATGVWRVDLDPLAASSEGRALTVTEAKPGCLFDRVTDKAEVKDILVGEVWFASGQSNMECPIWGANARYRDGKGGMMTQMTRLPLVRYVKNPRVNSDTPKAIDALPWRAFTREGLADTSLSAVAFYYARELHLALGVPVGIVDSSWGGTPIDVWIPGTCLWNGMVDSWKPMAMRGFIWYQGCSNAGQGDLYREKMHKLYDGWAEAFENLGLKLYFAQLAPWHHNWLDIVEAQNKFAAEEKNAALAVTADIGNFDDIHPNDKETVAQRLVLHALRNDYGFDIPDSESPVVKSVAFKDGAAEITFDHAKSFYVYNRDYSHDAAFEVAGADGVWKKAAIKNFRWGRDWEDKDTEKEYIDGPKIVVASPEVAAPVKVRYMGTPRTAGSVYNEMTLPLGPFETK